MKMKQLSFTGIILALVLTTGVATAFAVTSAGGSAPSAPAKQSVPSSSQAAADDKTLNGLFETYTVAEYEQAVKNVELYADEKSAGLANMKSNLAKLKADNGKGEFIVYKPFLQRDSADGTSSFSYPPEYIMAPNETGHIFTKEEYSDLIENTTKLLDQAVKDEKITKEQKTLVLDKMNANLAKM